MGYYIDLNTISLDAYRSKLTTANLLPSRRILKENIVQNFNCLKQLKIQNLNDLLIKLKTREKIQQVAQQTGIEENYLTILAREIKSMLPKPNRLIDIPGVPAKDIEKLNQIGIKNTLQLYDHVLTEAKREQFSKNSEINYEIILKLAHLTDLSRIRWVNHTFAYMLYEVGYKTSKEVARADHESLHKEINELNKKQKIFKGQIGSNDIKLCVLAAQDVPKDMQFP